jgi:hypothetical protein
MSCEGKKLLDHKKLKINILINFFELKTIYKK